jgi:hypothetical protein
MKRPAGRNPVPAFAFKNGPVVLGGAAMTEEDPIIIQMYISHYTAILKLTMDDGRRSCIERLLAEATSDLENAMEKSGSEHAHADVVSRIL